MKKPNQKAQRTTHDVRSIVRDELHTAKPAWQEDFVDAFTEKVAEFKDTVVTMLDAVMGELKKIREEQALMSNKLSEHTDTLESHDKRIKKIERTTNLS